MRTLFLPFLWDISRQDQYPAARQPCTARLLTIWSGPGVVSSLPCKFPSPALQLYDSLHNNIPYDALGEEMIKGICLGILSENPRGLSGETEWRHRKTGPEGGRMMHKTNMEASSRGRVIFKFVDGI